MKVKKKNMDWKERRDYLVGKLIDGARALDELFDEADTNESLNLRKLEKELCRRYELTENQRDVLRGVVKRVGAARKKVSDLIKRFGLTNRGNFRNKKELYKSVYEERVPSDYFRAEPYGFCVGFYLPPRFFKNEWENANEIILGKANEMIPMDLSKSDLGVSEGTFHMKYLCFKVNYRKTKPISGEEKILSEIFGENLEEQRTTRHERKHIINGLIEFNEYKLSELSADLYSVGVDNYSLERDRNFLIGQERERLKKREERFNRLKELKSPKSVLDNQKLSIKYTERKIHELESFEFPVELIKDLRRKVLDERVLSYIVGTERYDRLERRLRLVDDYFERNPLPETTD